MAERPVAIQFSEQSLLNNILESEGLSCRHHWLIERAQGGPTSNGTCIKCGQQGVFRNSRADWKWDDSNDAAGRLVGLGLFSKTINKEVVYGEPFEDMEG